MEVPSWGTPLLQTNDADWESIYKNDLDGLNNAFQWAKETGRPLTPGEGWSQVQRLAFNKEAERNGWPTDPKTGEYVAPLDYDTSAPSPLDWNYNGTTQIQRSVYQAIEDLRGIYNPGFDAYH